MVNAFLNFFAKKFWSIKWGSDHACNWKGPKGKGCRSSHNFHPTFSVFCPEYILGKDYCKPRTCHLSSFKKPHLQFDEAKQKYEKNLSQLRRDCQSCVQKKESRHGAARVASPEVTSKRSRFQDTMKPLLASERPVTVPVCQHWRKLNLKCAYGEKCHKRHNIWTKNPSNQDNEEEVEPGPSTSQKITRTSSGSVYDRLGESTRSVHDRLGPTPPKKDKMSSNQSKPSIHERLSQ